MLMNKTSLILIVGTLLLVLATSCGEEDQASISQPLIEEKVAKKVAEFIERNQKNCQDDVLEAAGKIADSVLITQAKLDRQGAGKPPKPIKPEKPEIKTLVDSTPVEPIFDPTLEPVDTLQQ